MGGEKPFSKSPAFRRSGSPPRGRGKDDIENLNDFLIRITPAWAGKSPLVTRLYALAEDHPRVGGEKVPNSLCFAS